MRPHRFGMLIGACPSGLASPSPAAPPREER